MNVLAQACDVCGHDLIQVPEWITDPDTGAYEAECAVHGEDHGTQWIEIN